MLKTSCILPKTELELPARGSFLGEGQVEEKGSRSDVTILLAEVAKGNQEAVPELVPLVYQEMRRLAGRYMRRDARTIRSRPRPWSMRLI